MENAANWNSEGKLSPLELKKQKFWYRYKARPVVHSGTYDPSRFLWTKQKKWFCWINDNGDSSRNIKKLIVFSKWELMSSFGETRVWESRRVRFLNFSDIFGTPRFQQREKTWKRYQRCFWKRQQFSFATSVVGNIPAVKDR